MHVYLSGLWNGFVCFCPTNYDHNWFSHEIGHLHTNQFFGETKIGNRAPRSSKTCEICIKLFQSQGFGKHLGNFLFGSEAQLFDGSYVRKLPFLGFQENSCQDCSQRQTGKATWPSRALCILIRCWPKQSPRVVSFLQCFSSPSMFLVKFFLL